MAFIHGFMIAAVTVAGAASPQQPAAPAASAGKEVCVRCHDQVVAQFDRSAHSAVVLKEGGTQMAGCEACHGNGAKHAGAGGSAGTIRSFKNLSSADEAQACPTCHRTGHAMAWAGGPHQMAGVSCLERHKIHQPRNAAGGLTGVEGTAVSHAAPFCTRSTTTRSTTWGRASAIPSCAPPTTIRARSTRRPPAC